jgi:hypothetical protein
MFHTCFAIAFNGDVEIRYSLRSLAKYAPYIRKVWIFGDRPAFLSEDTSLIRHVPQSYLTRSGSPVLRGGWDPFVGSVVAERASQRHGAAGEMGS